MNRQEIEEIVIEIIAEELSIDTREINLDSTFSPISQANIMVQVTINLIIPIITPNSKKRL